jgi:hypothetical protein
MDQMVANAADGTAAAASGTLQDDVAEDWREWYSRPMPARCEGADCNRVAKFGEKGQDAGAFVRRWCRACAPSSEATEFKMLAPIKKVAHPDEKQKWRCVREPTVLFAASRVSVPSHDLCLCVPWCRRVFSYRNASEPISVMHGDIPLLIERLPKSYSVVLNCARAAFVSTSVQYSGRIIIPFSIRYSHPPRKDSKARREAFRGPTGLFAAIKNTGCQVLVAAAVDDDDDFAEGPTVAPVNSGTM